MGVRIEYGKGNTSQRVKITERVVAAARPLVRNGVPGKRLLLDTEQRGFGLVVNASGSKSYIVIRRVHGRAVRFKFRNAGESAVAAARKEAAVLLGKMPDGVDPVAERRRERERAQRERARGVTLRQALQLTLDSMKARGRSPRTIHDCADRIGRYLASWLNRDLASITRQECRIHHQQLADGIRRGKYLRKEGRGARRATGDGRASANRTFQLLRNVWRRAAREHEELGPPPLQSIDWHPEREYQPALKPEGLVDWHKGVMRIENGVRRDVLLFALYSGMRRTSVVEMRWPDVDLGRRVLRVPRPKGGEQRALDLPLSYELVKILARRLAEHDALVEGSERAKPCVWPSATSATGHIAEPREKGVPGSLHDLRRAFASVAARVKTNWADLKLLLNHALPGHDVTARYVTPDAESLRPAIQRITDEIRRLCEPGPPAQVVQLRGHARSRGMQPTWNGRVAQGGSSERRIRPPSSIDTSLSRLAGKSGGLTR